MFKKYQHRQTWRESLSIFLFTELILKKKEISALTIALYQRFELRDSHINSYNKWIDNGELEREIILKWVEKNRSDIDYFEANFPKIFKPKVELWSDRKKTAYYKEKLQMAFEFENYIAQLLKEKFNLNIEPFLTPEGQYDLGENKLGIEIKNDTLIKKYGNLYIEYAEKSNAQKSDFVKSGILKADNTKYFLIGDKSKFWIFRKEKLIEIYKEEVALIRANKPSKRGIKFKEIKTSKGFVFPVKNAGSDTISLEEMVAELSL